MSGIRPAGVSEYILQFLLCLQVTSSASSRSLRW